MASTKHTHTIRQGQKGKFGLLANGSSGPWEIAIDEATSGQDRWCAQIEGPSVTLYFEIPSPDIVGKIIQFFEPRQGPTKESSIGSMKRNCSLVIGKDKKTPTTLVKDDEYNDRFFLIVGSMDSPIVRFVIAGRDVARIADALRQVKQDLDDEE